MQRALWILIDPRTLVARTATAGCVTFIDVRRGTRSSSAFRDGRTLLVDGGLSHQAVSDIGDRVVAPVIRYAAFRRIDYLALSHGDPDHIGGAAAILGEFRPREVWEGIAVPRF